MDQLDTYKLVNLIHGFYWLISCNLLMLELHLLGILEMVWFGVTTTTQDYDGKGDSSEDLQQSNLCCTFLLFQREIFS